MAVETIYFNTEMYDILKDVAGENLSQKIRFVLKAYAEQRGVKVD